MQLVIVVDSISFQSPIAQLPISVARRLLHHAMRVVEGVRGGRGGLQVARGVEAGAGGRRVERGAVAAVEGLDLALLFGRDWVEGQLGRCGRCGRFLFCVLLVVARLLGRFFHQTRQVVVCWRCVGGVLF